MLPSGEGLRIGLIWSGESRAHSDQSLSLRHLAPLLRLPGITWYSLQPGEQGAELTQLPEAKGVQDLSPNIQDFTEAAALAGQLDLIISVDAPLAHLAGGLGLPLWVLLPSAPDWRWTTDGETAHWYPTARPFHQSRPGDWASVVDEVRRVLESSARRDADAR